MDGMNEHMDYTLESVGLFQQIRGRFALGWAFGMEYWPHFFSVNIFSRRPMGT